MFRFGLARSTWLELASKKSWMILVRVASVWENATRCLRKDEWTRRKAPWQSHGMEIEDIEMGLLPLWFQHIDIECTILIHPLYCSLENLLVDFSIIIVGWISWRGHRGSTVIMVEFQRNDSDIVVHICFFRIEFFTEIPNIIDVEETENWLMFDQSTLTKQRVPCFKLQAKSGFLGYNPHLQKIDITLSRRLRSHCPMFQEFEIPQTTKMTQNMAIIQDENDG